MRRVRSQSQTFPFEQLCQQLRLHGFTIGVDQYVRTQELLYRLEDRVPPEQLKTLLCPLFAKSPQQQSLFYQVFDESYAVLVGPVRRSKEEARARAAPKIPLRARRWPYVVVFFLCLVLLAGYWVQQQLRSAPEAPSAPPAASSTQPEVPQVVEIPANLVSEAPPAEPAPWYSAYVTPAGLIVLAAPLLLAALGQLYALQRTRAILRSWPDKPRAPYAWPLQVQAPVVREVESEAFHGLVRLMRRRQTGERGRLNVPGTVRDTVRSLGFLSPRYFPRSHPPEYLILIDRRSPVDLLARWYTELAHAFERERVLIELYFYSRDPRLLHRPGSPEPANLGDLARRFPDHRLCIFGSAQDLLHPVTGRLDRWAEVFETWAKKAVISAERPADSAIADLEAAGFVSAPPSVAAIARLVETWQHPECVLKNIWEELPDSPEPPSLDDPVFLSELEKRLGPELFQWLCTCAVYPELSWELTLQLAALPSMPAELVTSANLARLLRLPWFREGAIPQPWRQALTQAIHPKVAREAKEAIVQILERSPAPAGTYAELSRRLEIAVHRSRTSRDKQAREDGFRTRELLSAWPPAEIVQDSAFLELLDSRPAKAKGEVSLPGAPVTARPPMRGPSRRSGWLVLFGAILGAVGWTSSLLFYAGVHESYAAVIILTALYLPLLFGFTRLIGRMRWDWMSSSASPEEIFRAYSPFFPDLVFPRPIRRFRIAPRPRREPWKIAFCWVGLLACLQPVIYPATAIFLPIYLIVLLYALVTLSLGLYGSILIMGVPYLSGIATVYLLFKIWRLRRRMAAGVGVARKPIVFRGGLRLFGLSSRTRLAAAAALFLFVVIALPRVPWLRDSAGAASPAGAASLELGFQGSEPANVTVSLAQENGPRRYENTVATSSNVRLTGLYAETAGSTAYNLDVSSAGKSVFSQRVTLADRRNQRVEVILPTASKPAPPVQQTKPPPRRVRQDPKPITEPPVYQLPAEILQETSPQPPVEKK